MSKEKYWSSHLNEENSRNKATKTENFEQEETEITELGKYAFASKASIGINLCFLSYLLFKFQSL